MLRGINYRVRAASYLESAMVTGRLIFPFQEILSVPTAGAYHSDGVVTLTMTAEIIQTKTHSFAVRHCTS